MAAEVMAMRAQIVVVAALLVVSGCGRVSEAGSPSNYRLYEAAARPDAPIVAMIDTRAQAAHSRLPLGTPSLDWKHYYTANAGTLLDIDPETGSTLARVSLPADFLLPPATNSGLPGGLSQNGAWLVLQRFDGSVSQFLVVDTTYTQASRTISLAGHFTFDAISNDGDRVYLIQDIGRGDYHVRVYEMSSGALNPNFVVDKEEGGDAMSGLKLSGVASHDGSWLFSVYARPGAGAFIHALNLDSTFALCLELPGTGRESLAWSLALSPDGAKLYASNPVMGMVTVITTGNPSVGPTAHVDTPSPVWPAGAVVSADDRTLAIAGATGVIWLDTGTFAETGHALDGWTVRSLALSSDGRTLYAVNDRGSVAELSMAAHSVTTTFDPSIDHPIALMRVEAIPA
jgi:hypothetical protein